MHRVPKGLIAHETRVNFSNVARFKTHRCGAYVALKGVRALEQASIRAANPNCDRKKPCVYVGMSGLPPEERFANHKAGIKAASVVKRYGICLLSDLYEHLNPAQMERDLAEDLRRAGYTVTGGH